MKMPFQICLLTVLLGLLLDHGTASAQGNFENLDFESTTVPTSTTAGTLVSASEAIPGWTAYVGSEQQSQVLYNSLYVGTAIVALEGPGYSISPIIQGNYMVVLQSGAATYPNTGTASISQTGTIPASAQTLLFTASGTPGFWTVSLAGQNLPIVALSSDGPDYENYAANISSFAGQTAELEFTALIASPSSPDVNMALDNIQFSPTAIPEPQTWTLLLCGAGALAAWRRKLCR